MKKLFIIPGGWQNANGKEYTWLHTFFKNKGYEVIPVKITWQYRTLSDWIAEFREQFEKKKGTENHILGFSFGAMIACITAPELKPKKLYLSSLSPYFAENMSKVPARWRKHFGKKRVTDFTTYHYKKIAPHITAHTHVFYGSIEGEKWNQLMKRQAKDIHNLIPHSKLYEIQGADHDIRDEEYQAAVKKIAKK